MGRWLLLGLGLVACSGEAPAEDDALLDQPPSGTAGAGDDGSGDSDADGLCDATELELGTDPKAFDSDADQLPDLIEIASSFAPLDGASPSADQIAFMRGSGGSKLDFSVRSTVDGDGQSLAGWFSAAGSFYRDDQTAADFFVGATAVSADPIDGPRSINQESARFSAVLGRTRLGFNLRFDFGQRPDFACGRAYPFRYAIKSDDGETRSERFYLLVVGAGESLALDPAGFCLPSRCE